MIRLVAVAIVFLVIGGAVGRYALTLPQKQILVPTKPKPSETVFIEWKLASVYPSRLTQYGSLARVLTEKLRRASGGTLRINLEEPGATVPAEQCLDAVAKGTVQACWSSPGLWAAREKALILFSGVPFGPDAQEMVAWLYYGGGQELLDQIYNKYGVKSVLCGMVAGEAAGWFRREIKTVEDMKGLKMRVAGLPARVYGKLGVVAMRLPPQDIVPALRKGTIEAAEISNPAVDVNLKLYEVVNNYYFPGWHQRALPLEILIGRKAWEDLPDASKALIESTCGDTMLQGLAEGDAIQAAALREMRAKGVEIRTFPEPVLQALRQAWDAVAAEESNADPTFKRIYDQLTAFRAEYRLWRRIGRMP
jgi:TRAP-type mannitol/chloroaromatic compound transport system substrate-binding protein